MVVSPQRLTRWPSYVRDRHAAITYTTPRDAPLRRHGADKPTSGVTATKGTWRRRPQRRAEGRGHPNGRGRDLAIRVVGLDPQDPRRNYDVRHTHLNGSAVTLSEVHSTQWCSQPN
ncbi:hypothetical protein DFS55_07625 [Mycobacterium avium subsp. hominissuis]|uniref:Uncharacterized protein n=1 Tax=Mycobacterium avium subsp. hominissuis TaxID=439334 RepID=A0A3B6X6L5_MYCAV|nr:hypothetical protein DFS55_07625 [Mycobacterium avium subsp. hominissuis]